MNTSRRGFFFGLLSVFLPLQLWAQTAALENPQPDAAVSGISVISGWKCTAGALTVSFDGGEAYAIAYGTIREDTETLCNDTDNGFSFLWNWGRLIEGEHTVQVFDDGVEFANVTVYVTNYGEEFLQDRTATTLAPNFPADGQTAILEWQQSQQNFTVTQIAPISPPASGEFDVSGTLAFNNCTTPANDADYSYTATLSITPWPFGFLGVVPTFMLSPTAHAVWNLDGAVYGPQFTGASGGIKGTIILTGVGDPVILRGHFITSGVNTDTTKTILYIGVARFPGGEGICQFEGGFTATRIL